MSGGPDSTSLLLSLLELGRDVVAAHFDHDLRPGSAADATWVGDLCRRLGVPLVSGVRSRPLPSGSLQAAARELRGEFLEAARVQAGAGLIALAHTADDAVEGVLLHLLRGSGLAGLRGMPERRGPLVRPMLRVWREQVDSHLSGLGILARDDPSNRDPRHARVRVRHLVLPALEAARPGIGRRLHAVAVNASRWQAEAEAAAGRLCSRPGPAARTAELARAGPAVRAEAYRLLYARAGGRVPGLSRRHLDAIDRLVTEPGPPRSLDLPSGVRATGAYGELRMEGPGGAATGTPSAPVNWRLSVRPCPGCADPAAAHLRPGRSLTLGTRVPGLSIRPLGGRGTRKLQDILVDARVPRQERDRFPLVFAGGRLAWVPGLAVSADFAAPPGEGSLHVSLEAGGGPPAAPPGPRPPVEGGPNVL